MEHTFNIYIEGYPYKLDSLCLELSLGYAIPLNRVSIFVDKYNNSIRSININPFLEQYSGMSISYRFNATDKIYGKLFVEDISYLQEDFYYNQVLSFSFEYKLEQEPDFIKPVLEIAFGLIKKLNLNICFTYSNSHLEFLIARKKDDLVELFENGEFEFNDLFLSLSSHILLQ